MNSIERGGHADNEKAMPEAADEGIRMDALNGALPLVQSENMTGGISMATVLNFSMNEKCHQ